ncbi:MAG: transposase, partial [Proteobacteria bacterium]|nr:transposase [Pseudomonadota bacterium]
MYIEAVPNRNSRPAILLREGWREGNRVRKRTIANLSHWSTEKVENLRRVLKNEPLVSATEMF